MWRASVLTIFPDMFPGPLGASLAGKALAAGAWSLDVVDIRTFATDKHRTVDDTPAGGGPGMVMKADVLGRAIDATATDARPRLLMSPRGAPLTQARVEALTAEQGVVLVCGRFEGVDERVIAARGLEEVSVGDYVLSGGEIAAMALIDACVRLFRASWASRHPAPRRASPTAFWNIRNIPARSSGRAGRSRKSSPRATTAKSPPGAAPRPSG